MGKKSKKKQPQQSVPGKIAVESKQQKRAPNKPIPNKVWFGLLIVLIPTAIAFYPSLQNDWTNWDDPTYVTESFIVKNTNGDNIKKMFTIGNEGYVSILSLAIEYQGAQDSKSGEIDPAPFHRTNYLLHIFNALLVFLFCYLLFGSVELAAIVGICFSMFSRFLSFTVPRIKCRLL